MPSSLRKARIVAVESLSETLCFLQVLHLAERARLTASSVLALPDVVRTTDLGVVMPRGFVAAGGCTMLAARLPMPEFTVSLHRSLHHQTGPVHRWMKELLVQLFWAALGRSPRSGEGKPTPSEATR